MGKRVINSLFGVPLVLIAALLLFLFVNSLVEVITGDNMYFKLVLLASSGIALLFLIVFGLLKKTTVAKIFWASAGVR